MKRILVLLTVVALMVAMLAMLVAPAFAVNPNANRGCAHTLAHTGSFKPPFCFT